MYADGAKLPDIIDELKYAGLDHFQMTKVVKYVKKLKASHKTKIRNLKVMVTRRAHDWMVKQSRTILD